MPDDTTMLAARLKSGLLAATEIAAVALNRVDEIGVTTPDGIEAMVEALEKITALAVTHDDDLL